MFGKMTEQKATAPNYRLASFWSAEKFVRCWCARKMPNFGFIEVI
jgi:hypothetical protein